MGIEKIQKQHINEIVAALKGIGWKFQSQFVMLSPGSILFRLKSAPLPAKDDIVRACRSAAFRFERITPHHEKISGFYMTFRKEIPNPELRLTVGQPYYLQFHPVESNYEGDEAILIINAT